MIKLYQFPYYWNIQTSPFCLKLETYLRMTRTPFEIVECYDLSQSPTGKLPFIDDNGHIVADSSLIISYLKQKHGDKLDQHLSPEQKGQAIAIQRMLENHLMSVVKYGRWVEESGWKIINEAFFSALPKEMAGIAEQVREKMTNEVYASGFKNYSAEIIYQWGMDDINALADCFSDEQFFFGKQASSLDACIYAFLTQLLFDPLETPLNLHTRQIKKLVDYTDHMKFLLCDDNANF